MSSTYIDYHIEIASLREYFNELIASNKTIPIDGTNFFDTLKKATISSDIKPFLTKAQGEKQTGYYQKYVQLEMEEVSKLIPDFFSHEGDFYDLDRRLNICREDIEEATFMKLFAVKMLELNNAGIELKGFFNFQLFDNFHGNKEYYASFLQRLLSKDGNSHLFTEVIEDLKRWLNEQGFDDTHSEIDTIAAYIETKSSSTETAVEENEESRHAKWQTFLEGKKNFKIQGRFSDEEIRKYFSFLFEEKSANKNPFLKEEQVNKIFSNGLFIPNDLPQEKFTLNCDPKFPLKIIQFAIHQFYLHNSISQKDKKDYLIFFGCYIQAFQDAIASAKKLDSLARNMSGEKSNRCRINWNKYLPERCRN